MGLSPQDEDTMLAALHDDAEPGKPVPFAISGGARLAPGAIVAGKYLVERELAEGGLGIVAVATHIELGQKVAIKYLKPAILSKPSLVERFKREAQLAASIRSEHVVRVYDVGVLPTIGPYMVMELLDGEDLGSRLARGPLSVAEAVDDIVQACDALAEAHALGIVHRDLKPENLFVCTRRGAAPIVKILDFGISKVSPKDDGVKPRARQMTEDGERFGTPVYMSPEQIMHTGKVDARTDIWSIGVVLFELLTGTHPFLADSIPALGAQIVSGAPTRLSTLLPDASPALEAILLKCLEKNPAHRYRNVAELVQELVDFAAPTSAARLGRIKHVVLEGGESIRPPRSMTFVGPPTPASAFVPVPVVLATDAGSPPAAKPRRRAVIALACGIVAGAAIAALVLRPSAPERPAAGAVAAEVPAPPTPATTPSADLARPSAQPPAEASVRPVVSSRRAAPAASSARAVVPPPSDYNEFGDRK